MRYAIVMALMALTLAGCTQQQRARSWGGTATEDLPAGKKLVTVAWQADHLWVLTRDRTATEVPETYTLKESSSFGIIQGTVIVKEH